MKWLGIEIALKRLKSPVRNETHESDNNDEQPKIGSFISEPEVERALLDKSIRGFQLSGARQDKRTSIS
jgi:hypothetical protein